MQVRAFERYIPLIAIFMGVKLMVKLSMKLNVMLINLININLTGLILE